MPDRCGKILCLCWIDARTMQRTIHTLSTLKKLGNSPIRHAGYPYARSMPQSAMLMLDRCQIDAKCYPRAIYTQKVRGFTPLPKLELSLFQTEKWARKLHFVVMCGAVCYGKWSLGGDVGTFSTRRLGFLVRQFGEFTQTFNKDPTFNIFF